MAVIGISGKIGSGKDTVGKIIQYLVDCHTAQYTHPITEKDFNDWLRNKGGSKYWQIKKFAGKLKEVVSILTGIPVEDLEKQEVKDRLLGEEWIRYGYADGFFQSSKGTIMNNVSCSKERYEEELETNWQTAYKHQYTVRDLLQLIGTEAMRDVIHSNVWVNALFSDYKLLNVQSIPDNDSLYNSNSDKLIYPNWIITDVRFPNELKAIKDRRGITIRINRLLSEGNRPYVELHPSETALDNAAFKYIINNDKTIEELIEKVKDILIQEKIL